MFVVNNKAKKVELEDKLSSNNVNPTTHKESKKEKVSHEDSEKFTEDYSAKEPPPNQPITHKFLKHKPTKDNEPAPHHERIDASRFISQTRSDQNNEERSDAKRHADVPKDPDTPRILHHHEPTKRVKITEPLPHSQSDTPNSEWKPNEMPQLNTKRFAKDIAVQRLIHTDGALNSHHQPPVDMQTDTQQRFVKLNTVNKERTFGKTEFNFR